MRGRLAAVLVAASIVGGCADDSSGGGSSSSGDGSKASSSPQTARLSAADVPKGEWPLTVSEGVVRCEGSSGAGSVIFRAPDGKDYGVNGTAQGRGLPGIEPIWKKDPDIPGARINISPVLDRGLKLCK